MRFDMWLALKQFSKDNYGYKLERSVNTLHILTITKRLLPAYGEKINNNHGVTVHL